MKALFKKRSVDLHSVCYTHMLVRGRNPAKEGTSIVSLDKVLEYVGLQPEPKPHNALTGAKLEAEAFSRLIYGRQLLPEYAEFKIPEYIFTFSQEEK